MISRCFSSARRCLRRVSMTTLAAALLVCTFASLSDAQTSAVVLMYHRFGDGRYPSTNIRLEQFEEHLRELTSGKYKVLGLPEIISAIREKRALPDRTVGISIDDGFLSIHANAWPRLRAAGLPFTLFVATDDIDRRLPDFMSWDQLRELAKAGVTIGAHTASHAHMPMLSAEQSRAELAKSNVRFRAELGKQPELFAYPYGEFRLSLRELVIGAGYVAAFGQHSGVIHGEGDLYYLPRFAMAEAYGDMTRVRQALNALPLVVADLSPPDPFLGPGNNPPSFGFTVKGAAARSIDRLSCFTPEGKARLEILGDQRVEIRLDRPFPAGRARINCTAPAAENRWHWFSVQFVIPRK
jgi:peptidoglycan/xylan/chitin deacetylase (PgdA/CDA1 family)